MKQYYDNRVRLNMWLRHWQLWTGLSKKAP